MEPYNSFTLGSQGEHPIDAIVQRRVPLHRLHHRIRRASRRLMRFLDDRRDLWIDLEELINERAVAREEAYFNVGFERGFVAGQIVVANAELTWLVRKVEGK